LPPHPQGTAARRSCWRSLTVAVGWLAVGGAVVFAALVVDVSLNLFSWSGSWRAETTAGCALYLVALGVTRWLSGVTTGRVPTLIAALVTGALLVAGLLALPAEEVSPPKTLFGRETASPLLYRAARATLLALPGALFVAGSRRRAKRRRAPDGE
jgi:hypothetical protein